MFPQLGACHKNISKASSWVVCYFQSRLEVQKWQSEKILIAEDYQFLKMILLNSKVVWRECIQKKDVW